MAENASSPPPPWLELKDLAKNGREKPEGHNDSNEKERELFMGSLGLSINLSSDAIAYSDQFFAPEAAPAATLPSSRPTSTSSPVPPSSSSSHATEHIYYVVEDTGPPAGDSIPNQNFLQLIDDLDVERIGGRKIIQDLHLEVELLKYDRDQCRKGVNQTQVELQELNAGRHDYGGKGFYQMERVNQILFQIATAVKGQVALMALRLPKNVSVKTQLDAAFLDCFAHIKNCNITIEERINKTNALETKILEDAANQTEAAEKEKRRILTLVTESFTDLNGSIAEVAAQISKLQQEDTPPSELSTTESSDERDSSSPYSSDLLEVIHNGFEEIKKVVKDLLEEGYHQRAVPGPPNLSEEVKESSSTSSRVHHSSAIEEEELEQEHVKIPVLRSGRARRVYDDDDDDDSFYCDPNEIITPRSREGLDRKARHGRVDRYYPLEVCSYLKDSDYDDYVNDMDFEEDYENDSADDDDDEDPDYTFGV